MQDYSSADPALPKCLVALCKQHLKKSGGSWCFSPDCYEPGEQEELKHCRFEKCDGEDSWSLEIKDVAYDGKTFSANATLKYGVATYGTFKGVAHVDPPNPNSKPFPYYLGLSVARADGTIYDMPVIEVSASKVNKPIPLSAKVGAGAAQYTSAVWQEKKSPCSVDRHGCRSHGYVLDRCFVSSPEDRSCYRMGALWTPVPGGVALALPDAKILDAGGGPAAVKAARAIVEKVLKDNKVASPTIVEGKASHARQGTEVMYRSNNDAAWGDSIASGLTEALKAGEANEWIEAPARYVIAVGKPAP